MDAKNANGWKDIASSMMHSFQNSMQKRMDFGYEKSVLLRESFSNRNIRM